MTTQTKWKFHDTGKVRKRNDFYLHTLSPSCGNSKHCCHLSLKIPLSINRETKSGNTHTHTHCVRGRSEFKGFHLHERYQRDLQAVANTDWLKMYRTTAQRVSSGQLHRFYYTHRHTSARASTMSAWNPTKFPFPSSINFQVEL